MPSQMKRVLNNLPDDIQATHSILNETIRLLICLKFKLDTNKDNSTINPKLLEILDHQLTNVTCSAEDMSYDLQKLLKNPQGDIIYE